MDSNIINNIYSDIAGEDIWAYVKLQSLLEEVVTKYLLKHGENLNSLRYYSLSDKFKMSKSISGYNLDTFYELNKIANRIKHDGATEVVFDEYFLDLFFHDFNYFVNNCLPEFAKYQLDPSWIYNIPSIIKAKYIPENDSSKKTSKDPGHENKFYVNCGVGAHDVGFYIEFKRGENAIPGFDQSVFAIINNFLQCSTHPRMNLYLKELEAERGITLDFSAIFKYQLLILSAIRFGKIDRYTLSIDAAENERENIDIAFKNIKHYANCISALCQKEISDYNLCFSSLGISMAIDREADFCAISAEKPFNSDGRIWFSKNLKYSINIEKHIGILHEFIIDFFSFSEFRQGQLEAVVGTLNAQERSLCVMPTGSGKSLVFYMNALLSPSPTIVISPTNILAKDQIRNLHQYHNIDDCVIYDSTEEAPFLLENKLIYITPSTLQSYKSVLRLIHYNTNHMIANVVLDEVHTLCNWSHDFRPDYLMLCNNLFTFVDFCRYIGFTATANYKVLSDLSNQLKISNDNIIQPIAFNAGDFVFKYIRCDNDKNQITTLIEVINEFIYSRSSSEDRMIVFTHNVGETRSISKQLAELKYYNTACYDAEHTYSYQEFISGAKHVLIADSEMGIGINLPSVVCTVHYGLPNSKAQYVQEIGRANRYLNKGQSIVIFKDSKKYTRYENRLISFETTIDEAISIINRTDVELALQLKSIISTNDSCIKSSSEIFEIYDFIDKSPQIVIPAEINKKNPIDKIKNQKYLYKLHLLGIIDNWYIKNEDQKNMYVQIEVDFDKKTIESVKSRAISYFNMMGEFNNYTYEITNAASIKEIIYIFEKWFYNEFLRYHREQLLNVVEFFNYYSQSNDRNQILGELSNYFATTLKTVDDKKGYLSEVSQTEMLDSNYCVDSSVADAAEQLLTASYDAKLDLMCFLHQFKRSPSNSLSRFLRVVENVSIIDRRELLSKSYQFYIKLDDNDRLKIMEKFLEYFPIDEVINTIYSRVKEDTVYYGYLAGLINKEVWRIENV